MSPLFRWGSVTIVAIVLVATLGLGLLSHHAARAASTLTVTTTADTAPPCQTTAFSLRCALAKANQDGSGDTITFTIPAKNSGCSGTPAVCTIAVTTALPTLTASATTINGYSQPGAHPNTNALSAGDNAVLTIVLDGTKLNFNGNGFTVTGSGDTIEEISIVSFALGIATTGTNTPGTTIAGNFLGITPTGTTSFGNSYGVSLGSGGVTVGGTTPAAVNVLSHNLNGGIFINNAGTMDVVEGNLIGTDAMGTKALGNGANGVGVAAFGSNILIGGTSSTARNVISGNTGSYTATGIGVGINGTHITVAGNYIGTDASGTKAVSNGRGVVLGSGHPTTPLGAQRAVRAM